MGCVPNKKLSLPSSSKNSRVIEDQIQNDIHQLNQHAIGVKSNDHQINNILSASIIHDDIEEQTKKNTYLNSLPIKKLIDSNVSITRPSKDQFYFDNPITFNTQHLAEQNITFQKYQVQNNKKSQTIQNKQQYPKDQKKYYQSIQMKKISVQTPEHSQVSQKLQVKIPQINTKQPMNKRILPQYPTQQFPISPPQKSFNVKNQIPISLSLSQKPEFTNTPMKNVIKNHPQVGLSQPIVYTPKTHSLNQQMFNRLIKQTNTNDQGFNTINIQRINFGTRVR